MRPRHELKWIAALIVATLVLAGLTVWGWVG